MTINKGNYISDYCICYHYLYITILPLENKYCSKYEFHINIIYFRNFKITLNNFKYVLASLK
jgi:hypothetical protein